MHSIFRLVFLIMIAAGSHYSLKAQLFKKMLFADIDSNYIRDYTKDICARIYTSRKYTNFNLVDNYFKNQIDYRPNKRNVIGLGATYDFLTINIGLFSADDKQSNDLYGETNYLDLQFHTYTRTIVIDFYFQRYKGFYIDNPADVFPGWSEEYGYPVRSDISTNNTGIAINYVYNNKRFSYRAAFVQNEWQKKSAGSLIFGGSFHKATIRGDSSLLPSDMTNPDFFRAWDFNRASLSNTALNVGYTYSFIFLEHVFLTMSAGVGLGIGTSKLSDQLETHTEKKGVYLIGNTYGRVAMGYNSRRWYFGFFAVNAGISTPTPVSNTRISLGTGNIRINIVRRFTLKNPPDILDKIGL